jgi:hypothetical protein
MCEHHNDDDLLDLAELRRDDQPRLFSRRAMFRTAGIAGVGLAGAAAAVQPAAAVERSLNGWPVLAENGSALDRGFAVHGVAFPNGVRRWHVKTIMRYVAARFDNRVENLHAGWCWGYSRRRVTGGSGWSNHASGTALDFNAPEHPYGASGTFGPRQRDQIRGILNFCDGVVRWGGNYSGTKDEMHFEINVGPGSDRVARLAHKINNL